MEETEFDSLCNSLKTKHGEIIEVRDVQAEPPLFFAFRMPTRQDIQRLSGAVVKGGDPLNAQERMVFECALYPAKEELTALFRRRPGMPLKLADELMKASGANASFTATLR